MIDMSLMRGVLGRSGAARWRARAGRLPARRRRPRDPGPRPGRGARLRVGDRLRRADARRRLRLPHAALRLDRATTWRRSMSSPPTAAWSAPRNRRTPICSGACAAVAATSASSPAFDYKLQPVGPDVVGGAIAWRGEEAAGVLDLYRSIVTRGAARADLRGGAAAGAAGALALQGRPRQADRRVLRVLFGTARGRRTAARADQGVRQAGRRHPAAPNVRVAAGAARRHAAEGPALLLEVGVPRERSSRHSSRGRSSRRPGSCRRTPRF